MLELVMKRLICLSFPFLDLTDATEEESSGTESDRANRKVPSL